MLLRIAVITVLVACPALCGDWNKRLAADYLDSRQKEWFAWKPASAPGGACVSCHTGVTYLLARPALRQALGERGRTSYETGLLDGLRARVDKKEGKEIFAAFAKEPLASQAVGVEAVFASLFLTQEDPGSASARKAFDRMWSLQIPESEARGGWHWFSLNLDPFEMPESKYYGATFAALATGYAPADYRNQAEIRGRVAALTGYLQRERDAQPLHNRLMALWASTKLPEALPGPKRQALIDEIWQRQQADGAWTMESLGPWKEHPAAPHSTGNNSYATGFVAFVLQRAGVPRTDSRIVLALDWLRAHQDPESGSWTGESMNKHFEPGSMQARFMNDAATAFAALALLEGADGRRPAP
jgi:hypothetical protein